MKIINNQNNWLQDIEGIEERDWIKMTYYYYDATASPKDYRKEEKLLKLHQGGGRNSNLGKLE